MVLKIETAAHVCGPISRQVQEAFRALSLHYVVHHQGQQGQALEGLSPEILSHPAASSVRRFVRREEGAEDSAYLGTALARRPAFLGLASQDALLSLCTLNIERAENLKELQRQAWHLAWYALDDFRYYGEPAFRAGRSRSLIVRARDKREMVRANLCADIFSAVMFYFEGDENAVRRIAYLRSFEALSPRPQHYPEDYPFVVAREMLEFALEKLSREVLVKKSRIPAALKIAHEIGLAFDESACEAWRIFAFPAQEMAWRGLSKEIILSAAINASPDTYARITGRLVSELTGIEPAPPADIREAHSLYPGDGFNEKLHKKAVGRIFEEALAQSLARNSAAPFFEQASAQNEGLLGGQVMGWCAGALQAAARGFMLALDRGVEPEPMARREFENENLRISWESLRMLGEKIIARRREGAPVTAESVRKFCDAQESVDAVRKALGGAG